MIAARITGPQQVEILDVADPQPAEGEFLVRLTHVGLCGSDLPIYGGEAGEYPCPVGAPGHELAGVLAEDADDLRAGQRVLVDSHAGFVGAVAVSRPHLVPLPEERSPVEMLMAQPLGTVIHGVRKLPPVIGWSAIVVGSGPIGLLFVGLLRHLGCREVICVDPLADRLERAEAMGATDVFHGTARQALDAGLGEADLAVEAVGLPETLPVVPLMMRRGGYALMFGVPRGLPPGRLVPCDLDAMLRREARVVFTHGPKVQEDFGAARDLLGGGILDVAPIVSHVLPFARIAEAFDLAFRHAEGTAKIVLTLEGGQGCCGQR